jgi:hypothetical protein
MLPAVLIMAVVIAIVLLRNVYRSAFTDVQEAKERQERAVNFALDALRRGEQLYPTWGSRVGKHFKFWDSFPDALRARNFSKARIKQLQADEAFLKIVSVANHAFEKHNFSFSDQISLTADFVDRLLNHGLDDTVNPAAQKNSPLNGLNK